MKFSELIKCVEGRGVGVREVRPGKDPQVLGVAEDSRKVKAGDLFVARGGVKADGAKFIVDAMNRGAVAVVAAVPVGIEGLACAQVEDANLACALLAHEVAGNPTAAGGGMKMIGVTGTKGKTTVAYLMRSVLKAAGHKVGMIGTVEIDDGREVVPAEMTTPGAVELVEMFCRMRENGVTHCVMEVSSHSLHQRRVAGIDFAVAIFTNLTGDHLDYHKTMEEYAAAKAMLFEGLAKTASAVVNTDDSWAARMVQHSPAKIVSYYVWDVEARKKFSRNLNDHEWKAVIEGMTSSGMQLHVRGPGMLERTFQTPLSGKHNAYNVLSVVAGAVELGVPFEAVIKTLILEKGAPGRLQRVESGNAGCQVFVDYAHTHDALENVLTAVRATMGGGRLICVFGCGGDRDRTKRPKMGAVAERLADRVIVTNDNPRTEEPGAIIEEICAGFSEAWRDSGKISVEPDRRVAIRRAIWMAERGDVVLIAGKGHENYQIIGTTKHHFDDVEEAEAALRERLIHHQGHQEHQGVK
jgi:UDP-N-acetylmuramoyl-L-alanyl-D-glutamate--2,6-diaminopimelate ligase